MEHININIIELALIRRLFKDKEEYLNRMFMIMDGIHQLNISDAELFVFCSGVLSMLIEKSSEILQNLSESSFNSFANEMREMGRTEKEIDEDWTEFLKSINE